MVDRNIWIALPEVVGTIFHSFLLRARSIGERMTWQGYYAPAHRWLTVTAVRTGNRLHVHFREISNHLPEGDPDRRP